MSPTLVALPPPGTLPVTGAAGAAVLVLGAIAWRSLLTAPPRPTQPVAPAREPRWSAPVRRAGAVAAGLLAAALLGWLPPAVGAAGALAVRATMPRLGARRTRREAQRAFPDAVERIVHLTRAGLSPHLAVRAAAESVPTPIRPAFEAVVHRLDRGHPLGEALDALTDGLGPRAATIADAFGAADRYGLPLGPMLDQLARDARAERRRLDEAAARRLPVKLAFPLVACTLPSFALIAIAPAVLAALSSLGGTSW